MQELINVAKEYGPLLLTGQYPNGPLGGLAITLMLSVVALVFAFPLGILIAVARTSDWIALRLLAGSVIYLVRGVPLLMFIFWTYFFLPALTGKPISGFTTMVVTLVIYEGAYIAEIIRAGMEGLGNGQREAARAVGLSYIQTIFKVILPQALYNMTPALVAQFISIIKDTSLAYVIGVNEVTYAANQLNNALLTKSFEVFVALAIVYLTLGIFLSYLAKVVETRIHKRRNPKRTMAIGLAQAPKLPPPSIS